MTVGKGRAIRQATPANKASSKLHRSTLQPVHPIDSGSLICQSSHPRQLRPRRGAGAFKNTTTHTIMRRRSLQDRQCRPRRCSIQHNTGRTPSGRNNNIKGTDPTSCTMFLLSSSRLHSHRTNLYNHTQRSGKQRRSRCSPTSSLEFHSNTTFRVRKDRPIRQVPQSQRKACSSMRPCHIPLRVPSHASLFLPHTPRQLPIQARAPLQQRMVRRATPRRRARTWILHTVSMRPNCAGRLNLFVMVDWPKPGEQWSTFRTGSCRMPKF